MNQKRDFLDRYSIHLGLGLALMSSLGMWFWLATQGLLGVVIGTIITIPIVRMYVRHFREYRKLRLAQSG